MENKNNSNIDKSKFAEYADIKNKIKELTAEAKEIEGSIYSSMKELDAEKVTSDFGTFSIIRRKSYKYPDYVSELEAQYKEKKKESEENGDAEVEEKESIMFRSKTNKK